MRVGVYIDGFNLYYGIVKYMEKRNTPCFKWLDYWLLGKKLARVNLLAGIEDKLVLVKYFTALVVNDKAKARRHRTLLEALRVHGATQIVEGKYQSLWPVCRNCGRGWHDGEEKQSDVALGVNLVADAVQGFVDKAIVVTADSDQKPAIKMAKQLRPALQVVVAYPPEQSMNNDLACVADATMRFNNMLSLCQLPNPIKHQTGEIWCPKEWM